MRKFKLSMGDGAILVVVPHEDDEVILFGGLIARAVSLSIPVTVVLATNGDYGDKSGNVGCTRLSESLLGLDDLGLSQERVVFMGYGDTGMPENESFLAGLYREAEQNRVHPSHVGTATYALPAHADFHTQITGLPAPYTRQCFTGDLRAVLSSTNPTRIFTAHPADAHGDHAALFRFVRELVPSAKVYCGYAHSPLGDEVWPVNGKRFTCPPGLEAEWQEAVSLSLTPLEQSKKQIALSRHSTALKPDAVDYLNAFVKQDEIYFPMEAVR